MDWLYYALLLLLALAGLALSLLSLPGLWLIVGAAAVYALLTHGTYMAIWGLVALFLLATLSEILEIALSGLTAKRAGGTKRAMIGAITGGVAGAIAGTALIPVPLVGTVAGACAGSFVGAFGVELLWVGKTARDSFRVGSGAAAGRFLGLLVKTAVGVVMIAVVAVWALPVSFSNPAPTTSPATRSTTMP